MRSKSVENLGRGEGSENEARIYVASGTWMIQSNDPDVVDLFGTDTLPTAFRAAMTRKEVIERLKPLNPNYEFILNQEA